jgi:hypothetical protein
MLNHISGKKYKFDDQYAIADYAIAVKPQDVQLDYHQEISASFSMHPAAGEEGDGWPFLCKSRLGKYVSCPDKTKLFTRRHNYFRLNESSCLIYRHVDANTPYQEEVNSLASDPLVWHGNGAGKGIFRDKAFQSFKCFLDGRRITVGEYDLTMFSP